VDRKQRWIGNGSFVPACGDDATKETAGRPGEEEEESVGNDQWEPSTLRPWRSTRHVGTEGV
jgi:hypothetical protein